MNNITTFLDICKDPGTLKVLLFIKQLINLVFIIIPIGLIVMVTIDIFKNVISPKDDNAKKNISKAIKRMIYCIVLFIVPSIINITMNFLEEVKVPYTICWTNATETKIKNLEITNAKELVAQAEQNPTKKNIAEAQAAVNQITDEKNKKTYQSKINEINNKIASEAIDKMQKEESILATKKDIKSNSKLRGDSWVKKILEEARKVTDYIRENNYEYGDAEQNPATNKNVKKISCDRCVGWFLYNMGYTNQPEKGPVVGTALNFDTWLENNNFKKITNQNEIKAGDIIFTKPNANGKPEHVFLLGNPIGGGLWERYDCGSEERIRLTRQYSSYTNQPFKEAIGQFVYAYRAKEIQ